MRVRGRRECVECGTRWSYFETNSIECPDCGRVESRSVEDEPARHTDHDTSLDVDVLDPDGTGVDGERVAAVADEARRYLAARGFIDAGSLRPLDDEYVLAAELRHAADAVRRPLDPAPGAADYLAALSLAATDARGRPDTPPGLRAIRGRGVADAVRDYRSALSTWLRDTPDAAARREVGRLRDHAARVDALDGDVPVEDADRLLAAARGIGLYLAAGDDDALTRAGDALDDLE